MFDDIENSIVRVLVKIKVAKDIPIERQTDLFATGVLDSFGMIEYLGALEKEFDIKISNEDLVPKNFKNIQVSAQLVREHLSAKKGIQRG